MCSIEEETWSRSSQFGSSIEIGAAHLGENTHYVCNFCNFCDAMRYIMCSIEVGASAIITVRRCNWNWSGALRWGNVLEHQRKCHKLSQHLNLTANGDDDDDVTIIADQTNAQWTLSMLNYNDKVLWRKGSNMKASVPACHWIDISCFHVFQPYLWINGKDEVPWQKGSDM